MTEKVEAEYKAGMHNYEAAIKDGRQQPYRHIGKYRVRADAQKIVTGQATFLDDFTVPHMIYARILRSPYAHAKITRIDVEKAKAVPGVHCVLTYKDLPKGRNPVQLNGCGDAKEAKALIQASLERFSAQP